MDQTQIDQDQAAVEAADAQLASAQQADSEAHAHLEVDQAELASEHAAELLAAADAPAIAAPEPVAAAVGDLTPAPTETVVTPTRTAHDALNDIEAMAVQWGGDLMAQIRHLVAEAKSLL